MRGRGHSSAAAGAGDYRERVHNLSCGGPLVPGEPLPLDPLAEGVAVGGPSEVAVGGGLGRWSSGRDRGPAGQDPAVAIGDGEPERIVGVAVDAEEPGVVEPVVEGAE